MVAAGGVFPSWYTGCTVPSMAAEQMPLIDIVEHAVGNHLDVWDHAGQPSALDVLAETVTAAAMNAIPDGWAKVNGRWVLLESYNDECFNPDCDHSFSRHGCEHVRTTWEYDEPWRP